MYSYMVLTVGRGSPLSIRAPAAFFASLSSMCRLRISPVSLLTTWHSKTLVFPEYEEGEQVGGCDGEQLPS